MQHAFPSRQFSPKSETALGPIALLGIFSRTEGKLTLDGFHGLEVVGPQEGGGRSNDQA